MLGMTRYRRLLPHTLRFQSSGLLIYTLPLEVTTMPLCTLHRQHNLILNHHRSTFLYISPLVRSFIRVLNPSCLQSLVSSVLNGSSMCTPYMDHPCAHRCVVRYVAHTIIQQEYTTSASLKVPALKLPAASPLLHLPGDLTT